MLYVFLLNHRVVGNPLVMDPNGICRRTRPLLGRHADLCKSQPEIIQEVAKGARLGMRECQHQFHNGRWNCTSKSRNLAKILQQGEYYYSPFTHLKHKYWICIVRIPILLKYLRVIIPHHYKTLNGYKMQAD